MFSLMLSSRRKLGLIVGMFVITILLHRIFGQNLWLWNSYLTLLFLLGSFNLISTQRRIELLTELSIRDPLTNLYNRRYFEESLLRFSVNQTPFSMILIDLDDLKYFNDHYGHSFGDHLINETAQIILRNVRPTDIVSRWGGEEYAILMAEVNTKEVSAVAARIKNSIESAHFGEITKQPTASIGLSTLQEGQTKSQLFEQADQALYQAKTRKNCIVYN
ncbi:MAG: domain S-box-containing protein/diguanylate cyclase protein [Bacilli bacterium]|nr:domain S-box-containing protein/diguanylate cyclase protein [Bacilli bacterium]